MSLKLPKIIGHRCSRNEGVYENTYDALNSVIGKIDGVEIDVVLSKDNHLFFIHDTVFMGDYVDYELNIRLSEESIKAVNNRRIDEMNADEINELTLVDGQKIFNLDSFLSLMPKLSSDFLVNFELKSMGTFLPLVQEVYKLVESKHLDLEQFLFSSFNHHELEIGRANYPDVSIGILFEPSNTKGCSMYPWVSDEANNGKYIPYYKEYLVQDSIQSLHPKYICLNEFDLKPEVLNELQDAFPDVPVLIWWYYAEVSPSENNRLSNSLKHLRRINMLHRVQGIITDYPLAMKKKISKWL